MCMCFGTCCTRPLGVTEYTCKRHNSSGTEKPARYHFYIAQQHHQPEMQISVSTRRFKLRTHRFSFSTLVTGLYRSAIVSKHLNKLHKISKSCLIASEVGYCAATGLSGTAGMRNALGRSFRHKIWLTPLRQRLQTNCPVYSWHSSLALVLSVAVLRLECT